MQYGLKDKTIEKIRNVFAGYPQVERVVLYGSRAKGNYKNGSDIDLTLTGIELNLSVMNRISDDIDDLLLPYSFNISLFKQISNPDLVGHIERVGVVFYERE